jgi:hypothetical protein
VVAYASTFFGSGLSGMTGASVTGVCGVGEVLLVIANVLQYVDARVCGQSF